MIHAIKTFKEYSYQILNKSAYWNKFKYRVNRIELITIKTRDENTEQNKMLKYNKQNWD